MQVPMLPLPSAPRFSIYWCTFPSHLTLLPIPSGTAHDDGDGDDDDGDDSALEAEDPFGIPISHEANIHHGEREGRKKKERTEKEIFVITNFSFSKT